jgi:hypothetical protein
MPSMPTERGNHPTPHATLHDTPSSQAEIMKHHRRKKYRPNETIHHNQSLTSIIHIHCRNRTIPWHIWRITKLGKGDSRREERNIAPHTTAHTQLSICNNLHTAVHTPYITLGPPATYFTPTALEIPPDGFSKLMMENSFVKDSDNRHIPYLISLLHMVHHNRE